MSVARLADMITGADASAGVPASVMMLTFSEAIALVCFHAVS